MAASKIMPILKVGIASQLSRSIGAARLNAGHWAAGRGYDLGIERLEA